MTGDPFAGLLDEGNGVLLALGGDKQFRIGELELDHVPGDIDIGIAQKLFDKSVHERMPLPLDDEMCLIFFKLDHFYNHAPIFGNLTSIKVWVTPELHVSACQEESLMAIRNYRHPGQDGEDPREGDGSGGRPRIVWA